MDLILCSVATTLSDGHSRSVNEVSVGSHNRAYLIANRYGPHRREAGSSCVQWDHRDELKICPLTLSLLLRDRWIWGHCFAPDEISSQFSELSTRTQSSWKVHLSKKKKGGGLQNSKTPPPHTLVKTFSYLASVQNARLCRVDYWFQARIRTWC